MTPELAAQKEVISVIDFVSHVMQAICKGARPRRALHAWRGDSQSHLHVSAAHIDVGCALLPDTLASQMFIPLQKPSSVPCRCRRCRHCSVQIHARHSRI